MKVFLVGGFLGSGKTTAIKNASETCMEAGTKVGVITNDQGVQLVDSQYIQSFNIPSREVTDGCFCCNYDDLDEGIRSLLETENPEVVFAESVGSCTDIISTIVNPFEQFYPSREVVVSVFADARILPVLIKDSSHFFDNKIHYIYHKQLEEADVLVVNKMDLISNSELKEVKTIVRDRYPDKTILCQNSLDSDHISQWLAALDQHDPNSKRTSLDIDYDTYGAGEAELGWLDGEIRITSNENSAIESGYFLINNIYQKINGTNLPIGHLKFFLKDDSFQKKISYTVLNQSLNNFESVNYETDFVNLLVNARVQARPAILREIVDNAISETEVITNCKIEKGDIAAFKPGIPKPTYRMSR